MHFIFLQQKVIALCYLYIIFVRAIPLKKAKVKMSKERKIDIIVLIKGKTT